MRWNVAAKDDLNDPGLVDPVLGEYPEMPGLALTIEQARRLSGVRRCDVPASPRGPVERHVLRWSRDRRLIRAE